MNTIVITGATSGIGLETARILTQRGIAVIGIGHSEENCEHAKRDLLSENPAANIRFFWADLMQEREVISVVRKNRGLPDCEQQRRAASADQQRGLRAAAGTPPRTKGTSSSSR